MRSDARALRVMTRLDQLAAHTEEPGVITRPYGTPAFVAGNALVRRWMTEADLTTRIDPAGNLIGRYEGLDPTAGVIVLGSHIDSVRDAGRYDGTLGVILAIELVEGLRSTGRRLPSAIEICAWADEEGLRFGVSCLGSRAYVGTVDPAELEIIDTTGVTMADAVRASGGDPDALEDARRDPADLSCYFEVHIEQGPVLEARGGAVGVVTGIAGQSRGTVTFTGRAGHAGTTPPDLRRDALCAAAEWVLGVERLQAEVSGLLATVGRIENAPNGGNVIPGRTEASYDIRHDDDRVRTKAVLATESLARTIGSARQVHVEWRALQDTSAVGFSEELANLLEQASEAVGTDTLRVRSGAGHDAGHLSGIVETAMLFVRCAGGISHHPDESVAVVDVDVAIRVADEFLTLIGARLGRP